MNEHGDMYDFGAAIRHVRNGGKASRFGWNGKKQYIVLGQMKKCVVHGDVIVEPQHDAVGDNFIMFVGTSGYQCGWLASQADLLADDWILF